jgi:GNAT superfamily N-acetyltransferase
MLVAEVDDQIVGLRAFMRWRFRTSDGSSTSAVRAVDTATHPHFQGLGIFSRLTREAVEELRRDVGLVFNTPNEKSGPGYLKMGWQVVGALPVWIRVRHPARSARGLHAVRTDTSMGGAPPYVDAPRVTDVLKDAGDIVTLLSEASPDDGRLATERSVEYLRWRYASAPFDYRAVALGPGGSLKGIAVFRVRRRGRLWESSVADIIAPRDGETRQTLLNEVVHAADTDYVADRSVMVRHPSWRGWLRAPGGIRLMVNRLQGSFSPDPSYPRSWALSLGDLEIF